MTTTLDPFATEMSAQFTRVYLAAEDAATDLTEQISGDMPAFQRAYLLYDLAVQLAIQAETHDLAFGAKTTADDQHRSVAQALHDEAVLVSAIAATETAVATGNPRVAATEPRIEKAAGPVLDQLAAATDRIDRYDLLSEMYEDIEPVVGAEVAQGITWLGNCYIQAADRTHAA